MGRVDGRHTARGARDMHTGKDDFGQPLDSNSRRCSSVPEWRRGGGRPGGVEEMENRWRDKLGS